MKKQIYALLAALVLALALPAGCSDSENTVRIATKPMTEQYILGEMLSAVIQKEAGLQVELTTGVGGGTAHIHPGLVKGDFDLYPEYTGTAWLYVLKMPPLNNDALLYGKLTEAYASKYNLQWVGLYGFNNSYGLAVRRELAEKHNLRDYSDLAPLTPQLTFGGEYDFFEREDGFNALAAMYGFNFKRKMDMDIGLKYPAIAKGEIDAMNVFTTDGQIAAGQVRLLRDDKHFYPTYFCGTVVRQATLDKFPKLRPALMLLDGLLTDEDMSRLNYEVEVKGRSPRDVAHEFLRAKGILPNV